MWPATWFFVLSHCLLKYLTAQHFEGLRQDFLDMWSRLFWHYRIEVGLVDVKKFYAYAQWEPSGVVRRGLTFISVDVPRNDVYCYKSSTDLG